MKLRDFFFVMFFEIKAVISQFFYQFFYSFTVFLLLLLVMMEAREWRIADVFTFLCPLCPQSFEGVFA